MGKPKYIETPSEWFKRTLEEYKKANPDDILNKPYESEFFKSGKAEELINNLIQNNNNAPDKNI